MSGNISFPDEYLRVGEVAKMMRCSIPTIYRWAGRGDFPAPLKLGGSSRWSMNEVQEFLDAKRTSKRHPTKTIKRPPRPKKPSKKPRGKKEESDEEE